MAIKDNSATQSGGLCTLIGVDTGRYFDDIPAGLTINTNITATRLGDATAQAVEDPRYAGKALQVRLTTGSVADGGVVVAGWLNRTGATVPTGKYLIAVAV